MPTLKCREPTKTNFKIFGKRYIYLGKLTYDEAEEECQKTGDKILTFQSKVEYEALLMILHTVRETIHLGIRIPNQYPIVDCVGLNSCDGKNLFWSDGSSFSSSQVQSFFSGNVNFTGDRCGSVGLNGLDLEVESGSCDNSSLIAICQESCPCGTQKV